MPLKIVRAGCAIKAKSLSCTIKIYCIEVHLHANMCSIYNMTFVHEDTMRHSACKYFFLSTFPHNATAGQ